MPTFPRGTVTFLRARTPPGGDQSAVRAALLRHGGGIVAEQPDGLSAAFASADAALRAGVAALLEAAPAEPPAIALHAAEPGGAPAHGPAIERLRRLAEAAHPGQFILSQAGYELAADAPGDDVSLEQLGAFRLADLGRAEELFQVAAPGLALDFPRLKTLDSWPNNLPAQPSPLIGRERELAAVGELIGAPETRLVSLIGPSGVGKTRLALQLGAELLPAFADGAFAVPLAAIGDAETLVAAIAQALELAEDSGQPSRPAGSGQPAAALADHLRERELLLILDGAERLASLAPLAAELLAAAPRLKLLVTSQLALQLPGEEVVAVAPLAVPALHPPLPLAELGQVPAVALFAERARESHPAWALTALIAPRVADLCVHLAGMPLAIELVASQSGVFAPPELLLMLKGRLAMLRGARGGASREQTLRHVLDWAYDQLDAEEQTLFARLGVFAGGFTLEGAEAVCYARGQIVKDVLDGVSGLLSRQLLSQAESSAGELRYVMPDAVQSYACERLERRGETDQLRQRHAAYYLALAGQAELALRGSQQVAWLDRLASEQPDLRAALAWCGAAGDAASLLALATRLGRFWMLRGAYSEGRRWLDLALERRDGAEPALAAGALAAAGSLAFFQADYGRAAELYGEALELRRAQGDRAEAAALLNNLGAAAASQGDLARARALYGECLALQRELGDEQAIADTLSNLAVLASEEGRLEEAAPLYEECAALQRELGELGDIALALAGLGETYVALGRLADAAPALAEGLELGRRLDDSRILAALLEPLGHLRLGQDDLPGARAAFGEAAALAAMIGDRDAGLLALRGLAAACASQDPPRAVRLLAAGDRLRDELGLAETGLAARRRAALEERLRDACPAAELAAARDAGGRLTMEQALADALAA